MVTWHQPRQLDQLLELLEANSGQILAGGTDIFPAHVERPLTAPLIDISQIDEMKQVCETETHWRIGAGVSWSKLIATPLPPAFDGLKQAGREVGSLQIQNRATIVGNICNASPAADGIPPLLVLDAKVELTSRTGKREIALKNFITGNRQTQRRPNEVVTALVINKHTATGHSAFHKLGSRKHLVISIAMIAGRLVVAKNGTIDHLALSVGSCAATPQRLDSLEKLALGKSASDLPGLPDLAHFSHLTPINDIRASAEYRQRAACEMTRRLLAQMIAGTT